jgi:hypothetical protein
LSDLDRLAVFSERTATFSLREWQVINSLALSVMANLCPQLLNELCQCQVILANTSFFIVGNLSSNTQHMPRVTNVDSPPVVAGFGNHLSMFWILSYSVNIRKLDASRCSGSDVRCGGLGGKQLQEQIVGKFSI